MREFKIWLRYTSNSFQQTLASRLQVVIFLLGKSIRILLFLTFLVFLLQGTKGIGGYTKEQIIFFYLSFNLIDTLGQLFYREVYRFRPLIINGSFDLILLKPINPLIRVLMGGADVLDLIMLIFIIGGIYWYGENYVITNSINWTYYLILIANALIIATAIHITILGLGILTTSVDNLVNMFRDFSSMLRIPVDLYSEPLRFFLTSILPLGIMFTFPPQALMGLLSMTVIFLSIIIGSLFFYLSFKFWNFALKHYQGAGS